MDKGINITHVIFDVEGLLLGKVQAIYNHQLFSTIYLDIVILRKDCISSRN